MHTDCAIKVIAMPMYANPDGDIFGGWIVSQMDLAGALPARRLAHNRVVTVAIENIVFHKPVLVGDCLECYSRIEKIGRSSITVDVEVLVELKDGSRKEKVTHGRFIYVAIDENRKSKAIAEEYKKIPK